MMGIRYFNYIISLLYLLLFSGCSSTGSTTVRDDYINPRTEALVASEFVIDEKKRKSRSNIYQFKFDKLLDNIYLLEDGNSTSVSENALWSTMVFENSKPIFPTHSYYEINGKAELLTVAVKSENASFDKTYGDYVDFDDIGIATIEFMILGQTEELNYNVVRLPIRTLDRVDKLIQNYGLPADKKGYYMSWPCSGSINGHFLSPSAELGTMFVEHWKYDNFKNLVFQISATGLIMDISSVKEKPLEVEIGDRLC